MMRLAFQEAAEEFRESIVAGYFFNARGHSMAKSTQGMYRSLLHQIFSKMEQLPSDIPPSVAASLKRHGWSIPVLQNMLRTAVLHLAYDKSFVCYIDALDECAEDDIRDAVSHLEELASLALTHKIKFLICFASRHYPTITIRHHRTIDLDKQAGHQQDISDYVNSALRVTGSLGAELQRSILDQSAGVFLWAVLTVRILNRLSDHGGTRAQIKARLAEVPLGVQSLFREILQGDDVYLLATLQWVLFAQRPLTVKELYCAIMASIRVQPAVNWDETEIDIEGMRRFILASSKGLVDLVDNSDDPFPWHLDGGSLHTWVSESTVQLVHESLREYLLQGGLAELDAGLEGDTDAIVHARLAEACQTYISNVTLGSVSKRDLRQKFPFLECATYTAVHHMNIAFTKNALSREILRRFAHLWLTSDLVIELPSNLGRASGATMLCLSLAKTCQHTSSEDRKRMLDALNVGKAAYSRIYEPPQSSDHWNRKLHETLPLMQAAVDAGAMDVSQLYQRPGWKSLFALLLPQALITSSALGLTDVLMVLLECAGNAARSHTHDERMLMGATMNLQESTTQLLLRRGAKPDVDMIIDLSPSDEWTRPADGSEETRLRIMTALLDAGANVTGVRFDECIVKRHQIVELLADRGARIKYCTSIANSITGNCKHGYSSDCRAQGKLI
jgi:hypothetical protein